MIRTENLSKTYGAVPALRRVTMEAFPKEIFAVVGPSGCGKTTLLRLIAGFETPDAGTVSIDGVEMSAPRKVAPPYRRKLSMIFQDLALWPHMRVREHLEFVLRPEKLPREALREKVGRFLQEVGLNGLEDRYPYQLSGGEKQRLAIARALCTRPQYLLMDEPFGHLDPILRAELQELVRAFKNSRPAGVIHVSHDIDEVFMLADRIAVLREGKIEQTDTKDRIFTCPRTDFVRRFLKI